MSVRFGISVFSSAGILPAVGRASRPPAAAEMEALPFPLLHHRHEILEQIMRVMRPRRGFRVI
ncbi:MAG: hypothetical protein WB628_09980, partial [Candidatus Sulfotelmatobacter sp.]